MYIFCDQELYLSFVVEQMKNSKTNSSPYTISFDTYIEAHINFKPKHVTKEQIGPGPCLQQPKKGITHTKYQ